jgi:hypothetical protein
MPGLPACRLAGNIISSLHVCLTSYNVMRGVRKCGYPDSGIQTMHVCLCLPPVPAGCVCAGHQPGPREHQVHGGHHHRQGLRGGLDAATTTKGEDATAARSSKQGTRYSLLCQCARFIWLRMVLLPFLHGRDNQRGKLTADVALLFVQALVGLPTLFTASVLCAGAHWAPRVHHWQRACRPGSSRPAQQDGARGERTHYCSVAIINSWLHRALWQLRWFSCMGSSSCCSDVCLCQARLRSASKAFQ